MNFVFVPLVHSVDERNYFIYSLGWDWLSENVGFVHHIV